MSLKRDYKTKTDDEKELEPLGGPKSPDKESKTNGVQFGEYFALLFQMNATKTVLLLTEIANYRNGFD